MILLVILEKNTSWLEKIRASVRKTPIYPKCFLFWDSEEHVYFQNAVKRILKTIKMCSLVSSLFPKYLVVDFMSYLFLFVLSFRVEIKRKYKKLNWELGKTNTNNWHITQTRARGWTPMFDFGHYNVWKLNLWYFCRSVL